MSRTLTPPDLQAAARRSARALIGVVCVCTILAALGWKFVKGEVAWQWPVATTVSGVCLLCVLVFRRIPAWLSGALALLTTGAAMAGSAIATYDMAAGGFRFEAFNGFKLGALIVALIAPSPVWVGYTVVLVAAVVPVVQYFTMPVMYQGNFAVQEPWYAIVVATIAFFLLRYRLRAVAAERIIAAINAEKQTVDQIAKVFLAMRDLTMTPLQSIALTSSLLEAEKLDRQAAAAHLDRALLRLKELGHVLNKYEDKLDWSTTNASFDAVKDLERQLK